ncbi:hypothetical protein, partial [Chloroflexus sp.]|uniref:hypothetical protein n=1 Tax=Chloroflexus sp. TaxID=1904827 RepID=UPI00404A820E
IGWDAIRAYYHETLTLMTWMNVKVKPIHWGVVGEAAWLVGKESWAGQNRTRTHISVGTSTVCFIAHRHVGMLRLIQYVEAPLNARYACPVRQSDTNVASSE